MFAFTLNSKENDMQNGFDDFDTQVQAEEVYRDEDSRNEAGLTAQEYQEAMEAWEEERFNW